ncbi:hypothetical protein [Thioclava electrotropha]|uniref:hypothetical protein n=1 Tax=Thioclava electrotropha TaxID=1549850 RepID=UPI0023A91281|nr:hypothetical protein [Thioclava electrotropha]
MQKLAERVERVVARVARELEQLGVVDAAVALGVALALALRFARGDRRLQQLRERRGVGAALWLLRLSAEAVFDVDRAVYVCAQPAQLRAVGHGAASRPPLALRGRASAPTGLAVGPR